MLLDASWCYEVSTGCVSVSGYPISRSKVNLPNQDTSLLLRITFLSHFTFLIRQVSLWSLNQQGRYISEHLAKASWPVVGSLLLFLCTNLIQ